MEEKDLEILKQLACDLKNLSSLNYAILYSKSYTNLIGSSVLKGLERAETQIDKVIDLVEKRYLSRNQGDLVDLYKNKNNKESIQAAIKRLEK